MAKDDNLFAMELKGYIYIITFSNIIQKIYIAIHPKRILPKYSTQKNSSLIFDPKRILP